MSPVSAAGRPAPLTDPATPDVLTVGMTYRDIVFTGLADPPSPGTEVYAEAYHETWGGIANMTRTCRALGMSTALCTALGDDEASTRLVAEMDRLGVDSTTSLRHPGWSLPTTAALTLADDRALITVEDPPPAPIAAHLDLAACRPGAVIVDLRDPAQEWMRQLQRGGSLIYASRGFDPTGRWDTDAVTDICDVWMLNESEARAYTGLDDPLAAARWLTRLAPTVVVTRGARGLVAADAGSGEEAEVAAFAVTPRNLTGAGDITLAAFAFAGQCRELALTERLELAAYVVATTIAGPGGAACPPTLAELTTRLSPDTDPRIRSLNDYLSTMQKEELP